MREQTRAIKAILKSKFPDLDFNLYYRKARNYTCSSDRIVIKYTGEPPAEEIKNTLNCYTRGIVIFKHGEIGSISGNFASQIHNPNLNVWLDADLLEFIEIWRLETTLKKKGVKNGKRCKAG